MEIDLTKTSVDELKLIQNSVLRQLALRVAQEDALKQDLASVHDSHSSSHGKNSVFSDQLPQVNPIETVKPSENIIRANIAQPGN